jgi:hypothetical protein
MCKTLSGSCSLVTNMKVGSKRRVMLPHSSRFSALKDDTVQIDLELVGIAKGASHPRKQCPRVSAFGAVKRFGLMRSSESFPSLICAALGWGSSPSPSPKQSSLKPFGV